MDQGWSNNEDNCKQCIDCKFRDKRWYDTLECEKFDDKPNKVILNDEKCKYYQRDSRGLASEDFCELA